MYEKFYILFLAKNLMKKINEKIYYAINHYLFRLSINSIALFRLEKLLNLNL